MRVTFGVTGPAGVVRHQAQGLLIFLVGLGATSAALSLLDGLGGSHHALEVAVLTGVNLLVTVLRFVAMRSWVFVRE